MSPALERRQAATTAELQQLREREAQAPTRDAERLAAWQLADQRDPRPEPEVRRPFARPLSAARPTTPRSLAPSTRCSPRRPPTSSVTAAAPSGTLTAGSTRHNDRLTGLLDQLAAARQEPVEARQAAVWAACHPDITANATPNYALLALGLRQPVERTLGVVTQLQAERVVKALRADADVVKTAATPEQRARMEGRGRDERAGAAVWADTDEGRRQLPRGTPGRPATPHRDVGSAAGMTIRCFLGRAKPCGRRQ